MKKMKYKERMTVRVTDNVKNAFDVLSKRVNVSETIRCNLEVMLGGLLTEQEKLEIMWDK